MKDPSVYTFPKFYIYNTAEEILFECFVDYTH